jgi:hypothetical protein
MTVVPDRADPGAEHLSEPTRRLVDGVDHVYIPSADARAAFAVLTDELGLPVMWPFTSFGDFASGGVSVGSIKVEVIEANATAPWCLAHDPPRIQGIAFRPSTTIDDAYLAEVDGRSIPRTPPQRYPDPEAPRWTNVYFRDLISDRAGAFVCDYHVPQPRDIEAADARWQRVLDPLQPVEPATWQPVIGPAITLVPGDEERVDHLVLAVRSAATAREVWHDVSDGPLRGFPLRFLQREALPET